MCLGIRSACGDLSAYAMAEVQKCSVAARSAGDSHETYARRAAKPAVLASAEMRTLTHKVCDQLVDLFVLAAARENSAVDTTTGEYVFGLSKFRHETEPNVGKVGVLVTTYFLGVQMS